jgi:hypothetical protein
MDGEVGASQLRVEGASGVAPEPQGEGDAVGGVPLGAQARAEEGELGEGEGALRASVSNGDQAWVVRAEAGHGW